MDYQYISHIECPADLKKVPREELSKVAEECRDYLISVVSKVGGHLASSLGAAELTVALHYVFDAPRDKIVWDVGHQAYVHKILTGRRDRFPTIRQYGGLSGFPVRDESPYDAFNVAHAGTAISGALGFTSPPTNRTIGVMANNSPTATRVGPAVRCNAVSALAISAPAIRDVISRIRYTAPAPCL